MIDAESRIGKWRTVLAGKFHGVQTYELAETMAEEGNLLMRVPLDSGKGSSTDLTDSLKYFKIDISLSYKCNGV